VPKFVGIYRPIGEFQVAALEIEQRIVDVSDWGDAFAGPAGEREQLHLDDAYEGAARQHTTKRPLTRKFGALGVFGAGALAGVSDLTELRPSKGNAG
jgi:hypothetical protein